MSSVAKRYAFAFVDTAREDGVLDSVLTDVESLGSLISASPELAAFLSNPLVSDAERLSTLEALFQGKVQELTWNLLVLLVHRERLAELPSVLELANARIRELQGILPVSVVSAEPLLKRQQDELKSKLSTRTGKTIELTCSEDGSLLGGFRLQLGDLVEDYSLSTKLETFKQNVLNA